MKDIAEAKNFYLTRFADFEGERAEGPSWMREIRKAAMTRFAALGFPTTRDEEWKYTSIDPIVKHPFSPARYRRDGLTREWLSTLGLEALGQTQLVFINGHFSAELSSSTVRDKVEAGSLADALSNRAGWLEQHLARYADYENQSLVALNTALMEDGAYLFVPRGKILEEPIHLLFVTTAPDDATVCHSRSLIVLESGSQATVVESYLSLGQEIYFTNAVTESAVGEGSVLDHYKIQWESAEGFHIATHQARLERSSSFSSHSIALGGTLVRNELNVTLAGEGAGCVLNGLYMGTERQHIDNHTRIDHVKPRCASRELYKGILGGRSRGVFHGKIYVHKAAEKTDAVQTNKNLLLSDEAWVDTKPQLEIYNNDVKCSHGSTIGQLDQDALFYLRSRGIEWKDACALLTQGFASDITGRMKSAPVRTSVENLVAKKLAIILEIRD